MAPVVMSKTLAWSLQFYGKEGHDLVFVILASQFNVVNVVKPRRFDV